MPNLIHSLDSASLIMLRNQFSTIHDNYTNFYCIHDCFAVTAYKVNDLMVLIRFTYTILYADEKYIRNFYNGKMQYNWAQGFVNM
jgi:DNA-directed RNA polymerase